MIDPLQGLNPANINDQLRQVGHAAQIKLERQAARETGATRDQIRHADPNSDLGKRLTAFRDKEANREAVAQGGVGPRIPPAPKVEVEIQHHEQERATIDPHRETPVLPIPYPKIQTTGTWFLATVDRELKWIASQDC